MGDFLKCFFSGVAILLWVLFVICFYGAVAIVAIHFAKKFW